MIQEDDRANYWDLGDIRLRAAQAADAQMFAAHFNSSPAWIERAFERIEPPRTAGDAGRWLAGHAGGATGSAADEASEADGAEDATGNATGNAMGDSGGAGDSSVTGAAGDTRVFVIEDAQSGEFLGYIDVWEADARNGVFRTGVKMLEGKAGKGHATRAFARVLRFYFDELRYQKCSVYIYDFNEASHKFHKKLGFAEEGRLRREYYSGGRYYDAVYYGLTAEEFRTNNAGNGQ